MRVSGLTQEQVAAEKGWSRDKVAKYAALENISPVVWDVIVTAISKMVTTSNQDEVTTNVTVVTERLLRNILDLTETHQRQIIDGLKSHQKEAFKTSVKKTCQDLEQFF